MSVSVTDDNDLWLAIENDLEQMDGASVQVGFLSGDLREDDASLTQAQVAAWNEYGNERIPERPFMRPAIAENKGNIADMQEVGYSNVIRQRSSVTREMKKIGTFVQGKIQKKIRDVKTPENADSTIASKGSSNPLIDTGSMRQAVSYEVNL